MAIQRFGIDGCLNCNLSLTVFTLGDFEVNSYLLFNTRNKEAIIIDAPAGINKVLDFPLTS